MKKMITSVLLVLALCAGIAGCGGNGTNENNTNGTTVTESTDPKLLVGEQVDRTAWKSAFTDEQNYTVKSVVTSNVTKNGHTMSEDVTLVYRITADKCLLTIHTKGESGSAFDAEAYIEIGEDGVSMWERSKEGANWTEWDGELYPKEGFFEMFSLSNDLTFLKDAYANFSYSEKEKGYEATASGLTALQSDLDDFASNILDMTMEEVGDVTLGKFVLKLNGGKPGACLADLTVSAQPEARDDGTPTPDGEGDGQGTQPQEPQQPGDTGSGDGQDTPETPATGSIALTQVFYDYGKTTITRPEKLPVLSGDEQAPAEGDSDSGADAENQSPENRIGGTTHGDDRGVPSDPEKRWTK